MVIKSLKMLGIIFGTILILFLVFVTLFVNFSPEFGGEPTAQQKEVFTQTGHYEKGVFVNQIETSMDMSFKKMLGVLGDFIKGNPNGSPKFEIPVQHIDSLELEHSIPKTELVWFGHSAFLLQIDGKNILIDPMFGNTPAPHPFLGKGRYSSSLPISIEKLPQIDAIVISHDHYDHLDYGSIQLLKEKTKMFYVPLGVGAHFVKWGVSEENIVEMDWWQETQMDSIKIAFAPSRHFSGRGLTDRNSTLWGSWVIQGMNDKIYFSGDGGYGPHFKEIGEKYGPFDFAMIECGQYNENWSQIHMMPEESAQAGMDVRANAIMPIHWGAFTLALHSWTDPVERILIAAEKLNLNVVTPIIGEPIFVDNLELYKTKWWIKN